MDVKLPGNTPRPPLLKTAQDDRARESDRHLKEKLRETETQVAEVENTARHRIDNIRDEYVRQSETETERQTEAIEGERQKHYEEIRNLQRQHAQQATQIKRENERELSKLKGYYSDSIHRASHGGKQELNELQRSNQRQKEYELLTRKMDEESTSKEHEFRMTDVRGKNEQEFAKLKAAEEARFKILREKTEDAGESAEKYFTDRFQKIVGDQDAILTDTYGRTQQKLNELKSDSSVRLNAYSQRNRDPFYRMVELDADIAEYHDSFVLSAAIPPHEQKNISIAVRGNEVVVSGYRRSEDELKDDGKTLRTAAFQSFSESFPVNYPIDAKNVHREYDGNMLRVTFPKLPAYTKNDGYQAKGTAKLLRAERPSFPRNLPLNDDDLEKKRAENLPPQKQEETLHPKKTRTGGRTLS